MRFCLRVVLLTLLTQKSKVLFDISLQDPYENECKSRDIVCHKWAICRLDLVSRLFYCQCLPGYTGDGLNNCQEPEESIDVYDKRICNGQGSQTCLITRSLGEHVTFKISITGDYNPKQIAWFKFYSAEGPSYHSYRRRLKPHPNLLDKNKWRKGNLAMELYKIKEDDFYPNSFWVELETNVQLTNQVELYDFTAFELLNPSKLRFYFILESPKIDIGEYLKNDVIQIDLGKYFNISRTTSIKWIRESWNQTIYSDDVIFLPTRTEGIIINGIQDNEFGHIRAILYDFNNEVPGRVAIAQRLFDIRKDVSKKCNGSRSVHHCICNEGFVGNGVHCTDIDECKEGMPLQCLPSTKCENTYGSYMCLCPDGYEGDALFACIDIDECMINAGNCDENSFCVNTLGSFMCVCQKGYFKNGIKCQGSSIWTPWSPWSVCTVSCGTQSTMRVRLCTHPESGMRCKGPSTELKHCDNVSPCPVLGRWSEWSPWSTCTLPCSGISRRVRVCDNPAPAHGGPSCTGPFEENVACRHSDCPIDGGWSPWTAWSPCPSSCGIGVVKRSRMCDDPAPEYRGRRCLGHDYEEGSCGFPLDYCKYLTHPMDAVVKGRWI